MKDDNWPVKERTVTAKRRQGRPHGTTGVQREGSPYNRSTPAGKARTAEVALSVKETRRRAALSGDLPHEFLLKIMRGDVLYHNGKAVVPTIEMRIDCAKAAAPYFAPKLAQVEVMKALTDNDLDTFITSFAAEAGVSISISGEGQTPGTQTNTGTASTAKLH